MADRLYTRGFPSTYTSEDLKSKFIIYGRIKKVYVVTNDSKCHGIIRYYNPDNAQKAIEALNNQVSDGITWYVATCEKKNLRKRKFKSENLKRKHENYSKTIFLKDFPQDCTEEKLKELFEKYGKVSSVKITDKKAFLTYEEPSSAEAANKEEKLLSIDGVKVYVNKLFKKSVITNLISKKKVKKGKILTKPIENDVENEGELFD